MEPAWIQAMKKSDDFKRIGWTIVAVFLIIASPFFLSLAMKEIPIGTAYAIWTGIGVMGATLLGFLYYKEQIGKKRLFFIALIVIGCVCLGLWGA
jgi:multidrug transporter EmrE-like cation transporter